MIIKYVERENICGQMDAYLKEIGSTTICMVEVFILGKMGEDMKENIKMIRSM